MRAKTLTIEPVDAAGWEETAGVLSTLEEQDTSGGYGALLTGISGAAGSAVGGEYGALIQGAGRAIGGIVDGQQNGASAGSAIGSVVGQIAGTVVGGPAGGALGGAAGNVLGGMVGGAVEKATKKKPANKNARAQARAAARAKTEAKLAQLAAARPVTAPAQPKPEAQKTPTPRLPSEAPLVPVPTVPVADKRDSAAAKPYIRIPPPATKASTSTAADLPPNVAAFRETLTTEQRARLDAGIREGRGVETLQAIMAERTALETMEAELARQERNQAEQRRREAQAEEERRAQAQRDDEPEDDAAAPPNGPSDAYDDAAAPPAARPRPRIHIGLLPLKQHQLEAVLVKVPILRRLDTRLLRSMTGRGSSVRDTAGVDPTSRTYCAEPGETAVGIAKKLTGREERAAELLAANPGRREDDPRWRIPPGWMHFATSDTGDPSDQETSGTSRLYIIQSGDTPVGIATKSGAKAARPNWWNELKNANPQIPTKDNGSNFERFFAGQQLWIPDEWPDSPMFPKGPATPSLGGAPQIPQIPGMPQIPGLTTPSPSPKPNGPNTTIDPGVPLQAQALLAYWASSNQGAANPADYGTALGDLTGTTTTRFTTALASFQAWHNARNPAAPLKTDGVLDGSTYQALYADTVGGLSAPGPGAVPWGKPNPQQPQGNHAPAQPQGVPGIAGGLPQLGGLGAVPNLGAVLINVLRNGQSGAPSAPLPPGAVPGFHVAGQPETQVWNYDGTTTTLPPGMQPLDVIYGTPPADFVWQGGNAAPGPQNLPWVGKAQPIPWPQLPSLPWPWGNGPAPAPQNNQQAPANEEPKKEPAKDSGAALPIVGLLTALAMSS